ncbi:MAG: thioesterase domain-containing protein [Acidobacteriota bacterium]|nr:thioesterase domain-containing protein [Acidobacteriota bacterium]
MANSETLASRLAHLSPAQRALAEKRLRGGAAASGIKSSVWSPLVEIQPGTSTKIFFGVHALSGTVTGYLDLARRIGEDQTFYALQARGIDTDDEPHARLEMMAAYYLEALREFQPEGPYLLGGYSLGGHIAFEMAQQLCAEGARVGLLALLDTSRSDHNTGWDGEFDGALYWHSRFRNDLNLPLGHLRSLAPDRQVDYVVERLKLADKQPPFMSMPHANPRRMLKVEKGNHQALFTYKHKPYPGVITLLRTARDARPTATPDLGWGPLAAGGVEIHRIPGDHKTMLKSPNIEVVGRVLKECIAKAA